MRHLEVSVRVWLPVLEQEAHGDVRCLAVAPGKIRGNKLDLCLGPKMWSHLWQAHFATGYDASIHQEFILKNESIKIAEILPVFQVEGIIIQVQCIEAHWLGEVLVFI